MNPKVIGIIVLFVLVIGALGFYFISNYGEDLLGGVVKERIELTGYIGSEKKNFLENPKVIDILKKKYGITIDFHKAGSIEMVQTDMADDADFIWPSSQVALELFKLQGKSSKQSEIIFNSPIVIYSWDFIVEALIEAKVVNEDRDSYYIEDFPRLIEMVLAKTSWEDIGLTELHGKMAVVSTDPTKSNSGNMFAGLIANLLYGNVVDETTMDEVLPGVLSFFERMGMKEHSTGVLFEKFISRNWSASIPLVVGYENQVVEFSLQNPEIWPKVKDRIRILYPEPTVWSSHPLIAKNDKATALIDALKNDDELQKLAWEEHGFRTGIFDDPKILKVAGIPEAIAKIVPVPNPKVMEKIIEVMK